MHLIDHELYQEDVRYVASFPLPWEKLEGGSILLSGASGLIGSLLVDAIMWKNKRDGLGCGICALGRSLERARERFSYCWGDGLFRFIPCDVSEGLPGEIESGAVPGTGAMYVMHLASNTHPVAYSTDPVGTITTNILGTRNMLDVARRRGARRFVFASSNEVYGENRGDAELFDEAYCGYIDCNTLRAGYPESKRCGEALCQAYLKQHGIDVVIPRLTRSYGPGIRLDDSKASSQFVMCAVKGRDIVLKSDGTQFYSYTYAADAVTGLLAAMLCGEAGEAYNVADQGSDIRLRDMAERLAAISGRKVVYELPDELERAGYSKATKARLDASKIKELGWHAGYEIGDGLERTVRILRDCTG